jgi:hypothetical protein
MSDADRDPKGLAAPEPSEPQLDDDDVRALLKSAMRVQEATAPPPDVLRGVQKKIRQRSRGKFYADGWSTGPSPKSTYFVTALVMLGLLVVLYFFLVPSGWGTP